MAAGIFIGDETTACGFRLAGLEVRITAPEAAAAALAAAREARPPLIVMGAEHAAQVPEAELDAASRAVHPPVLVVADAAHHAQPPDLAEQVRRQVGAQQ